MGAGAGRGCPATIAGCRPRCSNARHSWQRWIPRWPAPAPGRVRWCCCSARRASARPASCGRSRQARGTAPVLVGACDDLLTPADARPLRDASPTWRWPAGRGALTGGRPGRGAAARWSRSWPIRGADGAGRRGRALGRRRDPRRAALLAAASRTCRPCWCSPTATTSSPRRIRCAGCSAGCARQRVRGCALHAAVARRPWRALAGGTRRVRGRAVRAHRRQPVLRHRGARRRPGRLPPTVVDAVLARVRRLDQADAARAGAARRRAVAAELPLARAPLGDVTVLARCGTRGVRRGRPDAVAFRHELARRAVRRRCPPPRRWSSTQRVLRGVARPRRGRPRAGGASRRGGGRRRRRGRARPGGRAAGVCGGRPGPGRDALPGRAGTSGAARSGRGGRPLRGGRMGGVPRQPPPRARSPPPSEAVELRERLGGPRRSARRSPPSVQQWTTCGRMPRWPPSGPRPARPRRRQRGPPVLAPGHLGVVLVNVDREREGLAASTRRSRWPTGSAPTRCSTRH